MPSPQLFPIFNAGYTVAETIYDTSLEKMKHAVKKYLTEFDPDIGSDFGTNHAGEAPALEMIGPKNSAWPGMPNNDSIDKNSLVQHIEYPILLDDEFGEFNTDRTGWTLHKGLPRLAKLFEPLQYLVVDAAGGSRTTRALTRVFSRPDFKEMIQKMWALEEFYEEYGKKLADFKKEVEEMGYPMIRGGVGGAVPYDSYSNFLRGTMLTWEDLFERPEEIEHFINDRIETVVANILDSKGIDKGKHVFMALHKGVDGFISDEQYREYYWKHLRRIILAIIEAGRVPYVFCEGKYNTRLEYLTDVPPGKVFYHFEDVDMARAKKLLGGIACITGGFPAAMLDWSTPDKVRDAVKKLLDDCAPGGGFIFATSCGLGKCKRENVEAMFDTVKTYGKY